MIKFTYIAFVVILIFGIIQVWGDGRENSMIVIVVNIIQHQNQG